MDKIFTCHPFSYEKMILTNNRLTVQARFLNGSDGIAFNNFILDSGAIISTMSKFTAIKHGVYEKDVLNFKATVGGFNKQPMFGRVISVKHLHIGILGVKDTLFFVPDSDDEIAEVLGSNVLNGLVPIPEFKAKRIWIYKNKDVPAPYHSESLGVDIACEVLAQEEIPTQ